MHQAWRGTYRALMGNLEITDNMEGTGVGGMMILNWILNKPGGRAWTGLNWLREEQVAGSQTMGRIS
jgi:hypothetical protein